MAEEADEVAQSDGGVVVEEPAPTDLKPRSAETLPESMSPTTQTRRISSTNLVKSLRKREVRRCESVRDQEFTMVT
jgi:hypothetical protein